jgi:hypothetical protein
MTDAVISYTDEDTGLVFRWHGGAYIDVGYMRGDYASADSAPDFDGGDLLDVRFRAFDVINVWNMAGMDGRPEWSDLEFEAQAIADKRTQGRMFRTVLELFEARCQQYLAEAGQWPDEAPES